MGGAYVALAEGTEGAAVNSATPAVRDPFSTSWFDYDLGIGISFPGAFTHSDFDNHGDNANVPPNHASSGSFTDLTLGATLQFGPLGVSATGDLQQFQLTGGSSSSLTMQIGRWKALGAYGLWNNQLVVGGGGRIVTMQILDNGGGGTLLTMTGVSPEAGAILMPTGERWRVGATVRGPVSGGIFGSQNVSQSASGVRSVGAIVLPDQIIQPWEIEPGVAFQLGPRPLNPGWEDPHDQEAELRGEIARDRDKRALRAATELALLNPAGRREREHELAVEEKALRAIEDEHLSEESDRLRAIRKARYRNWPREKLLLLASVLVTGPSPGTAVSVEGFLDQRVERVGQSVTLTPRAGFEAEPLPNRLVLRTGSYLEPSRYEGSAPRQHFTFGGDIHLFPLSFWGLLPEADWKIAVFVDLAPRYQNTGLSIGNWE